MEDQKWSENKTDSDQRCAAAAEIMIGICFILWERGKDESIISKNVFWGEWNILDKRFRSRLRDI